MTTVRIQVTTDKASLDVASTGTNLEQVFDGVVEWARRSIGFTPVEPAPSEPPC